MACSEARRLLAVTPFSFRGSAVAIHGFVACLMCGHEYFHCASPVAPNISHVCRLWPRLFSLPYASGHACFPCVPAVATNGFPAHVL